MKVPLYQEFDFRIAKTPATLAPAKLAPGLEVMLDKAALGKFKKKDKKKGEYYEAVVISGRLRVADDIYTELKGASILKGYLNLPEDGIYTFHFRPIGDGRIILGDNEVFSYAGVKANAMPRTVRVPLKKGLYPIVIDTDKGAYELEWEAPKLKRRNLKQTDLLHLE